MTIGGKRQRHGMVIGGKILYSLTDCGMRRRHGVPEDIVVEILSKLPVKSVRRFRCVSKSLLSSINNPQFVKLHLNRSHTLRLLAISSSASNSVHSVDLETSLSTIIPCPLLNDESCAPELVGSCNGLFCFRVITDRRDNEGKFIIVNPSTRESKTFPDFQFTRLYEMYGFGYAESIDDYKFVKILCDENMVHILSMRNNAWTIVYVDCPYPYPYSMLEYEDWGNPSCGIPLNGAIHWAFQLKDEIKFIVCAFDLVRDKFKFLPTPDTLLISHYDNNISVGVLGGCLALMCSLKNCTTYGCEFWVMKEYGEKESWTRISTIHLDTTDLTNWDLPLCFWWKNNREMILFDDVTRLILYDAKDGAYKDIFAVNREGRFRWISGARLYVESLVLPNCYS